MEADSETAEASSSIVKKPRKKIVCPVCFVCMQWESEMETHLAEEHLGFLPWMCLHCEFRSCSKEKLSWHCNRYHPTMGSSIGYMPNEQMFEVLKGLMDRAMNEDPETLLQEKEMLERGMEESNRLEAYGKHLMKSLVNEQVVNPPIRQPLPRPSLMIEPPKKRYRIVSGLQPGSRTQLRLTLASPTSVVPVQMLPSNKGRKSRGGKTDRSSHSPGPMQFLPSSDSADSPSSSKIQLPESVATASVTVHASDQPLDLQQLIQGVIKTEQVDNELDWMSQASGEDSQEELKEQIAILCSGLSNKTPQCGKCKEVLRKGSPDEHVFFHMWSDDKKMARYVCSFPSCSVGCHISQLVSIHIQHEHSGPVKFNVIDALNSQMMDVFRMTFDECFAHLQNADSKETEENAVNTSLIQEMRSKNRLATLIRGDFPVNETRVVNCTVCNVALDKKPTYVLNHISAHMLKSFKKIRFSCNVCDYNCAVQSTIQTHGMKCHSNANCFQDHINEWDLETVKKCSMMCFGNETFLLQIMPQKWIHHQPEQNGDSKNDGEIPEKNDEKREDRNMTPTSSNSSSAVSPLPHSNRPKMAGRKKEIVALHCGMCKQQVYANQTNDIITHLTLHLHLDMNLSRYRCKTCGWKNPIRSEVANHCILTHGVNLCFDDLIMNWDLQTIKTISELCFNDGEIILEGMPFKWRTRHLLKNWDDGRVKKELKPKEEKPKKQIKENGEKRRSKRISKASNSEKMRTSDEEEKMVDKKELEVRNSKGRSESGMNKQKSASSTTRKKKNITLPCKICNKTFKFLDSNHLLRHVSSHMKKLFDMDRFRCSLCEYSTPNRDNILQHLLDEHDTGKDGIIDDSVNWKDDKIQEASELCFGEPGLLFELLPRRISQGSRNEARNTAMPELSLNSEQEATSQHLSPSLLATNCHSPPTATVFIEPSTTKEIHLFDILNRAG
ncbi:hypothetical protein WR25_05653 [Diploscapter pachys]|uniref:C2H2-type domain-containing protein n=1 Tax=Diploscapter pachys TaxID=2018661 RepID=A0A2A2KRH7_9BILA|nr:hypothetical protein WR25_05653 [Diploscapter pachys]